jgi:hypothetical protein
MLGVVWLNVVAPRQHSGINFERNSDVSWRQSMSKKVFIVIEATGEKARVFSPQKHLQARLFVY